MFSRSQNDNGTYNSRCLYCFLTIASDVESEDRLDKFEARHTCPERALADLQREKSQSEGLASASSSEPSRPN